MPKGKRYNDDLLINIVELIKPNSGAKWKMVASKYMEATGEVELRDPDSIKKYFFQKLCNKLMKPTGSASPKPIVARAQKVWRSILVSTASSMLGKFV
jgi:hypothetical protein